MPKLTVRPQSAGQGSSSSIERAGHRRVHTFRLGAHDGGGAAYEDGFTLLDLTRKYYREAGLDAKQLDLLIR
jgi:hypothetical protein